MIYHPPCSDLLLIIDVMASQFKSWALWNNLNCDVTCSIGKLQHNEVLKNLYFTKQSLCFSRRFETPCYDLSQVGVPEEICIRSGKDSSNKPKAPSQKRIEYSFCGKNLYGLDVVRLFNYFGKTGFCIFRNYSEWSRGDRTSSCVIRGETFISIRVELSSSTGKISESFFNFQTRFPTAHYAQIYD